MFWIVIAVVDASSRATLRTNGSYGQGSWADRHGPAIDLFDVVVDDGSVVMYRPSEESRLAVTAVGSRLDKKHVAAQAYLPTVPIVIEENEGKACEANNHAYFVHPWADWTNAWHFMNDAMSLAHHVGTTPGYNASSRRHQDGGPSTLYVFKSKKKGAKKKISLVDVVLRGMFSTVAPTSSTTKGLLFDGCAHLHWGVGARIIGPVDGGGFVEERREAAAMLRRGSLDACKWSEEEDRSIPVVLMVERSCGTNGPSAARCLSRQTTATLRREFLSRGVQVEWCCNWRDPCSVVRTFARADIVVGMHGAGLANALFAREKFVLVELHGSYGANLDLFRKIAQARRGGYVSVTTVGGIKKPPRGTGLDSTEIKRTVDCSLAIWNRGRQIVSFSQTKAACAGLVGEEHNGTLKNTPVGTQSPLRKEKRALYGGGLDGAAPVDHTIDCVSPHGNNNVYTCPEAVGVHQGRVSL